MSQTLSKGYKKPETGDRGTSFFADLESNIDLSNAHEHNGSDGEKISSKNITSVTSTIASGGWSADAGGGVYTATVTFPSGITYENNTLSFINDANGARFFPTARKTSATTMLVTVNDNTLDVTIVYG